MGQNIELVGLGSSQLSRGPKKLSTPRRRVDHHNWSVNDVSIVH